MSLARLTKFTVRLSLKAYIVLLMLSMVISPFAPVFVSKAFARPPNGVNLPASGGTYNAASYITNEYWGDTAQSCGYSYDTQGGTDSTGWTQIPCTTNTPIPPPSGDGEHTLYISAWDNPDYTGFQYTWSVSFIYDNTAPNVTINSPTDASDIADADWSNPSISWDNSATCEYHLDSDSYQTSDSGCASSLNIPKPSSGTHTLYVRGTDAAGNQTESSVGFTLDAPIDNGGGGGGGGPSVPTVTFSDPTSITQTGVVLHADVTSDGGDTVSDWGVSYGHSSGTDRTNYEISQGADLGAGSSFTATVSGLTCGTKYYYRTWAGNGAGYGNSDEGSFITSACEDADITSGLVADWQFDDGSGTSASDSSGNGNTGTLNGGAVWDTGKTSGGLTFDGTGYVTVSSPNAIPIKDSGYTISAWIKTTGGSSQGIIGWGDYDTQSAVNATRIASAGDCSGGNGIMNYWWGNDVVGCASSGTNLNDGTWHHVVTEYDGSTRQIYIDGVLATFDNPSPINVTRDDDITIGVTHPGNGETFTGTIDNVRIYNRALSQTQIAALETNDGGVGGGGGTPPLDFDGGEGTVQSPYQISTCAQLPLINSHLSSSFLLTANLSCADSGNDITLGVSDPFTGTFDGGGHTISMAKTGLAGLFHETSGATITNLGLGGTITNAGGVLGALVGHAVNTNISFVYSSTTISSNGGDQVGGLVGYLQGGSIRNSYATGSVSAANWNDGGLVGLMGSAVIAKSYATGAVDGDQYVGGLVGSADNSSSIIASFAANSISATNHHAGLIGAANGATLTEDYFDGGLNEEGGTCASDNPSGCTTINGDGQSSTYFFNNNTNPPLTFWDFNNAWATTTDSYPILRGNEIDASQDPVSYDGGTGASSTPYQISTCAELEGIGQDDAHLAAHYVLTGDVYCNATSQEGQALNHSGAGFYAIGNSDHPFTGVLNGAGYSIYNLFINAGMADYVGLFGYLQNATVEHLYLHGGAITGDNYVGLVAGYAQGSTLDEVETGFVQYVNGNEYVGGLVGLADTTTITDSNYDGTISANSRAGGLVGEFDGNGMDNSLNGISGSRSSATVTALSNGYYFGGLAGFFQDGYIRNSHVENNGPVTITDGGYGSWYLGGLAGGVSDAEISDSYANAAVSGLSLLGGLVGGADTTIIENSYSQGTVQVGDSDNHHSAPIGVGGLVGAGFALDEITNSYSNSAVTVYAGDSTGDFLGDSDFYGGLAGFMCFFEGGCVVTDSYATGDVTVDQIAHDGQHSNVGAVGGFIGYLEGGNSPYPFSHNYASGNVSVTVHQNPNATSQTMGSIGGMYGYIENATTTQSDASGDVTVDAPTGLAIGGFVGGDSNSTYTDDFAYGSVSLHARGGGIGESGGFVGSQGASTVDRSYAAGDVSTTEGDGSYGDLGGFVGYQNGTITNSFALGSVSNLDGSTNVGGFTGNYQALSEYDSFGNDFYLTTPNSGNAACVGSDSDQNMSLVNGGTNVCTGIDSETPGVNYFFTSSSAPMFDEWDFANNGVWLQHSDHPPTLRGLQDPYSGGQFDGGTGTTQDPYQIGSCSALQAINDNLGASYVLEHDLTCSGFTPIGANSMGGLTGSFDGAGHSITETIVQSDNSTYTGLFATSDSAYIHDLTLHGSVTGGTYVGSLLGDSYNARIEHVYSDVTVNGGYSVGGTIGEANSTRVNDLVFGGTVTGTGNRIGGIIGNASDGYLFNLTLDGGTVSGQNYVGGLVGRDASARLTGGNASGTVTGIENVGGAVGYLDMDGGTSGQIESNATVTGVAQVGGLIGYLGNTNLSDALSKGTASGYSSVGGLVGYQDNGDEERTYSSAEVIGNGFAYNESNSFIGGFVGQSNNSTIFDSFSKGVVHVIYAYDGDTPLYVPSQLSDGYIAGFAGYFYGDVDAGFQNNYYDVLNSGQYACESVHGMPHCTGVNSNDTPNSTYFDANSSVDPLTTWNFDSIWQTTEGTPSLQLPVTADLVTPTVVIATPTAGDTLTSWNPVVDWGGATFCYYSYGESDANIQVDCSQAGHDIPAPTSDGQTALNVRAENASHISTDTVSATFTYFTQPFTFSAGDGSQGSPYHIDSCEALTAIQQHPSADYVLTKDLSCDNLTPVVAVGFGGIFNGADHTITYTQTDDNMIGNNELGLFAFLNGATIENLNLAGTITSSDSYAGAVASWTEATSTLQNISSSMIITGNSFSGGLIGYSYGPLSIANSFVTGTLSAQNYNGGLVGYTEASTTISDSYFSGTVTSASVYTGGFIGYVDGPLYVVRSYVSGTVVGPAAYTGGIIGFIGGGEFLTISDSFVDGAVQGGDSGYIGSLAGYFDPNNVAVTNSWYDPTTTVVETCGVYGDNVSSDDMGGGCATATSDTQFINNSAQHPFENWDFNSVWQVHANGHPTLRSFDVESPAPNNTPTPPAPRVPTHVSGGGSGGQRTTAATPVKIPQSSPAPATTVTPSVTSVVTPSNSPTKVRDITVTMSGTDVVSLQQILIAQNTGPAAQALAKITATGYFGAYTRAALAEYQKAHHISPANGYFGAITRAALAASGVPGIWW